MGSRTLTEKQCNVALKDAIAKLTPRITIIPAEPEGACEFARKFVVKNGITSMLVCKQKHRAAGMYEARTELVLKESDCCVFLHDGTSKGTRNEIEMCIKMGIPYLYYLLDGDKMVLSKYNTKDISDGIAENMGEDIPSFDIEIEELFNL